LFVVRPKQKEIDTREMFGPNGTNKLENGGDDIMRKLLPTTVNAHTRVGIPLGLWVPGALSLGLKRPGIEADHSTYI
jgi:hypothetical protein